jgi:transcriptional regulator with AAA-type ATPase domain
MEIGYASGYASSLLGRLVVFRELECRSMGHKACRIVGKPAEQWDDIDVDLAYLDPSDFLSRSTYTSGVETTVAKLEEPVDGKPLVGISAAFVAASQLLQRVAPTQATVLLIGESGVGKELFARTLYQSSSRQHMPLVALNCAALPENLVEAELFGVERGLHWRRAFAARAFRASPWRDVVPRRNCDLEPQCAEQDFASPAGR